MQQTVIVVEDEPLVRWLAMDFVVEAGLNAVEAEDADQALALIEQLGGIDMMFTDIRMPGSMDGLELARVVQQRWPATRVIVASGHGSAELATAAGAQHFFPKPYRAESVVAALKELSNQRV